jgi:hypothetical protein
VRLSTFRILVVGELLCMGVGWVLVALSGSAAPMEPTASDDAETSSALLAAILGVIYLVWLSQAVGLIGLLLPRPWARHAFALGTAGTLYLAGFGETDPALGAPAMWLGGLFWILAGAIIGLVYTPTVWKTLFPNATSN